MIAFYESLLHGTTPCGLFSWRGDPVRDLTGEAELAGWRALQLDTTDVVSVPAFYDEVSAAWNLPSWFGRNLDALFDVLADLTETPVVLVWDGSSQLAEVDPMLYSAVIDVLRDAVGQSASFAVIFHDDLMVSDFDALL